MKKLPPDWRLLDSLPTTWFAASSLTDAAGLAGRILAVAGEADIDVRASGVRVRLADAADAAAVSSVASERGCPAIPSAVQELRLVIDAADADAVAAFWGPLLGYRAGSDGVLADPLLRDPAVRVTAGSDARPLRNRIHADVSRPAAVVETLALGEASGAHGLCHTDPEGNEVDIVPGGPVGDGAGASDWQAVFGALACYRVASVSGQAELAQRAAALADQADFPLLIDLRPGLVILDSGKDLWEADAYGPDVDFGALATAIQSAALELGATADPDLPRFVQFVLDAADEPSVQQFWLAALGYERDPRSGVSDIVDPRRLNPVLVFQDLEADADRRAQRNRLRFELLVPADVVGSRVAVAVAAGGRILERSRTSCRLEDPEGNELVITGEGLRTPSTT